MRTRHNLVVPLVTYVDVDLLVIRNRCGGLEDMLSSSCVVRAMSCMFIECAVLRRLECFPRPS